MSLPGAPGTCTGYLTFITEEEVRRILMTFEDLYRSQLPDLQLGVPVAVALSKYYGNPIKRFCHFSFPLFFHLKQHFLNDLCISQIAGQRFKSLPMTLPMTLS